MEPQNSHYHFGASAAAPILPVSAFSAYSLLRNCNYLLSPHSPEVGPKPLPAVGLPRDCPLRSSPATEDAARPDTDKFLPQTSFLTAAAAAAAAAAPLFGYSHNIHMLPDHLSSRTNVVSPSLYNPSLNFRRQRGEKKPIPEEQKDEKYFERRRRNNQAAKKSRDARKVREDQIALKATILEHENAILRAQVLTLREETSSLRQMLLQKKALELTSRDSQICRS